MSEARDSAELRRRARAGWSVRVFRQTDPEAEADADTDFWLQLSPVDRVALAWSLSRDLYGDPDEAEPGLSRSSLAGGPAHEQAAARPQDLADVAALERAERRGG